jgi:hypothetical protein
VRYLKDCCYKFLIVFLVDVKVFLILSQTRTGKERARYAALRHGGHVQEDRFMHREVIALTRQSKDLMHEFEIDTDCI